MTCSLGLVEQFELAVDESYRLEVCDWTPTPEPKLDDISSTFHAFALEGLLPVARLGAACDVLGVQISTGQAQALLRLVSSSDLTESEWANLVSNLTAYDTSRRAKPSTGGLLQLQGTESILGDSTEFSVEVAEGSAGGNLIRVELQLQQPAVLQRLGF